MQQYIFLGAMHPVTVCLTGHDFLLQPVEFLLSASTGSLLVVAVAMVRIYLGWSYVGNRLLSASVPYEETGW